MDRWSRTEYAARLFYVSVLAAGLGATAAGAETMTLGGRTVVLEPPVEYCALDPARPEEADIIAFSEKMQQPRNHVIMQLADCDELADFRAGKRQSFGRYGQFFVPISDGAVMIPTGYSRASMLTEAANEFPKLDSGAVVDEVANKLRRNADGNVSSMHFLGVLKQDDAGLYLGIAVGKTTIANQTVYAGAMGVVGLTLVNQVPVSLGLYQANVGAEAVPDLLSKVQETLASLVQGNAESEAREGSTRWSWHGFDLEALARAALIGGLIGAAIGLAGWAWSRRRKNRAGS
jgi:hypothetical protein